MLPAVFGAAIYQINIFIGTILASLLPKGSVSFLYYADRIVELPLGVFAIAVGTAALPSFSAQIAAGRFDEWKKTISFSLRLILFISDPGDSGPHCPAGAHHLRPLPARRIRCGLDAPYCRGPAVLHPGVVGLLDDPDHRLGLLLTAGYKGAHEGCRRVPHRQCCRQRHPDGPLEAWRARPGHVHRLRRQCRHAFRDPSPPRGLIPGP